MRKKLFLIISLIFLFVTIAPTASAKDNLCSYCGSEMRLFGKSNEYSIDIYTLTCKKYSNRLDVIRVWGVDYFYECQNPSCRIEWFYSTRERVKCFCDHDCYSGFVQFLISDNPCLYSDKEVRSHTIAYNERICDH